MLETHSYLEVVKIGKVCIQSQLWPIRPELIPVSIARSD